MCEVRRIPLPHTRVNRDRHGIVGPRPDRENGRMTVLRIDDLLANAPVDPEAHLDAARVERYARMVGALPPVVVFETPEGMLLADGYHRVAAARRRGLQTVEAEVRSGSRHDALRYAAMVGAAQRGISAEEAASYIQTHARNRRT
jgi:ParB-like nuclease domain